MSEVRDTYSMHFRCSSTEFVFTTELPPFACMNPYLLTLAKVNGKAEILAEYVAYLIISCIHDGM